MEWKGMGHQTGSVEDILGLTSLEEKSESWRLRHVLILGRHPLMVLSSLPQHPSTPILRYSNWDQEDLP